MFSTVWAPSIPIVFKMVSRCENADMSICEKLLVQMETGLRGLEAGQHRIEEQLKVLVSGYENNFPQSPHNSVGGEFVLDTNRRPSDEVTGFFSGGNVTDSGNESVVEVLGSKGSNENSYGNNRKRVSVTSCASVVSVNDTLPENWPASVKIRGVVKLCAASGSDSRAVRRAISRRYGNGISLSTFYGVQEQGTSSKTFMGPSAKALDPKTSLSLVLRDWISLAPLAHDVIITPYLLAWQISPYAKWMALMCASAWFWTMDIAVSFVTGYREESGEVVLSRRRASRRYLTHWFPFDLLLTILDWICFFVVMTETTRYSYASHVLRALRLLRLVKLYKLFRMSHLTRLLEKMGVVHWQQSSMRRAIMSALDMLLFICLAAHLLSCSWYSIGANSHSEPGVSWLDMPSTFSQAASFRQATREQQYLASLHFITALITTGSADVAPQSSFERAFNVLLLWGGFFAGTIVISIMSGFVLQYIMSVQDQAMQLKQLRRYLNQNRIHPHLQLEVIEQTTTHLVHEKIVRTDLVDPMLKMLPSTLHLKLIFAIHAPPLVRHPLFELWQAMELDAICELCSEAVEMTLHLSNDPVFFAGTEAQKAFIVRQGTLCYMQKPGTSKLRQKIEISIKPETWLSEAALWSHWVHVGDLSAETASQVMVVSAEKLWDVVSKYPEVAAETAQYATNFHDRIKTAKPPHAVWADDLQIEPQMDAHELLTEHVGIGLLQQAKRQGQVSLTQKEYEKLKEELANQKSSLRRQKDGRLHRIVAVEALRVQNSVEDIFIQIGEWDEERGMRPKCQYPAKKRPLNETPQNTLKQLVKNDLPIFHDCIEVKAATKETVETKDSEKYTSVQTSYSRTVYMASLTVSREFGQHFVVGTGLVDQKVYMLPKGSDRERYAFYTWMPDDEFEERRNRPAKIDALKEWLPSRIPPCRHKRWDNV